MTSYEIRLVRTLRFWGLSRSRKPRRRIVRSCLVLRVEGIQDEASWNLEMEKISQEFELGRTWKFLSSKRIEPSREPG
jgi:hypothetical protein